MPTCKFAKFFPDYFVCLGIQQGPVLLTAKNLQCMRAILSVAHCHGAVLGSAWHLVLTTLQVSLMIDVMLSKIFWNSFSCFYLQHLAWILGLKPSGGGSLKSSRPTMESSTAALVPSTAAVMADLPVLSSMLSRLFESSQLLDDVALHHLIDALRQLSQEAMEVAYSNRVQYRLSILQSQPGKKSPTLAFLGAVLVCCGQTTGNRPGQLESCRDSLASGHQSLT